MIYPYMTLNDETEICCSGIQDDGSVKVYVEKPDNNCGLKSMVCVLPGYEVKKNYKFSENELSCILNLIKKNSIGIRILSIVAETLNLRAGDHVEFEMKDDGMILKKKQNTAKMFEEFYGKPLSEITVSELGPAETIDWGEDVGGEVF